VGASRVHGRARDLHRDAGGSDYRIASSGVTPAAALLDAANAVATAIKTSDDLPAESQHGQGLIDAISAFAIAGASGIDTAALQDNPLALDEIKRRSRSAGQVYVQGRVTRGERRQCLGRTSLLRSPARLERRRCQWCAATAILGQTVLLDAIHDAFGPAHDTNGLGGLLTPLGLDDAISDIQAIVPAGSGADLSDGGVPTLEATSVSFDQVQSAIDGGSPDFNPRDIVTET